MTIRCSVFIATSLDGYIARKNGDIDWLPSDGSGEDYGYRQFVDSVDALVMGRNTYETVRSFGEWPYGEKPVVVLSHRALEIPQHLSATVKLISGSPPEIVDHLGKEGAKHLYIDGGKTIQAFLNAGLIQEMILTRIPVIIGEGIPLFGPVDQDITLLHVETRDYENGLVQSRYTIS
ncbi:MAG TPA: dihydrofolate reductase family protein [bacterium]|nr:dihydrofolate reductase family protein [bacterium]